MYFQERGRLWYFSENFGKNEKDVNKKEDRFQDESNLTTE